jgi:hypothetical protein
MPLSGQSLGGRSHQGIYWGGSGHQFCITDTNSQMNSQLSLISEGDATHPNESDDGQFSLLSTIDRLPIGYDARHLVRKQMSEEELERAIHEEILCLFNKEARSSWPVGGREGMDEQARVKNMKLSAFRGTKLDKRDIEFGEMRFQMERNKRKNIELCIKADQMERDVERLKEEIRWIKMEMTEFRSSIRWMAVIVEMMTVGGILWITVASIC